MFNFDVDKIEFQQQHVVVYNSMYDELNNYRCVASLFRKYKENTKHLDGPTIGLCWLHPQASIVSTLQKVFYWFNEINNVRAKYLLIHPKLKAYLDVNNVQMIEQYLPIKTEEYCWVLADHIAVEEVSNIPCNKIVIVGEDNCKTCMIITVFSEKDIDKLG
jgi:hypothetical protein